METTLSLEHEVSRTSHYPYASIFANYFWVNGLDRTVEGNVFMHGDMCMYDTNREEVGIATVFDY